MEIRKKRGTAAACLGERGLRSASPHHCVGAQRAYRALGVRLRHARMNSWARHGIRRQGTSSHPGGGKTDVVRAGILRSGNRHSAMTGRAESGGEKEGLEAGCEFRGPGRETSPASCWLLVAGGVSVRKKSRGCVASTTTGSLEERNCGCEGISAPRAQHCSLKYS